MPHVPPEGRLGRTLARLSETLHWPDWDPARGSTPSVHRPDLREALARARRATKGGAYVRVLEDSARRNVELARAEARWHPLAGVLVAVKDLIAVAGEPLGAGSAVRDDAPPETADAAIVAMLRGLGAVVIGRTALHEFAYGVTGVNEHTGSPPNPHDPTRVPGGSSSGSAVAVAEGSASVAIGTDTGGSIRIPAALCGVVGFKAARDTYPLDGVFPLAPSLDHVGLLARSVGEATAVHAALGNATPALGPVRSLGLIELELEEADGEVSARVVSALDGLRAGGIALEAVRWPHPDRAFATSTAIMFSEASAIHRDAFARWPERYSPEVRRRLEAGFEIDAPTYVAAKREQATLRDEVLRVLDEVDAVVTPTVPTVAPPLAKAYDADTAALLVRNTRLGNIVGLPAISVPIPGDGLPVGLQLVARDEATLLKVASEIERRLKDAR